jgi:uncharacterized protein
MTSPRDAESSPDDRATILWRRLDLPGHEAAELARGAGGWRLSGVAVLAHSERPCRLQYVITCDAAWHTRRCRVRGYVGAAPVCVELARDPAGEWTVGGARAAELSGCNDVDLGFSPATNLLPIRRLGLSVGASASVRAAWIRFPELTTEVREQVYTRVAPERYVYESAGGVFRRELTVDSLGFVLHYPDFWRAEATAGSQLAALAGW